MIRVSQGNETHPTVVAPRSTISESISLVVCACMYVLGFLPTAKVHAGPPAFRRKTHRGATRYGYVPLTLSIFYFSRGSNLHVLAISFSRKVDVRLGSTYLADKKLPTFKAAVVRANMGTSFFLPNIVFVVHRPNNHVSFLSVHFRSFAVFHVVSLFFVYGDSCVCGSGARAPMFAFVCALD